MNMKTDAERDAEWMDEFGHAALDVEMLLNDIVVKSEAEAKLQKELREHLSCLSCCETLEDACKNADAILATIDTSNFGYRYAAVYAAIRNAINF